MQIFKSMHFRKDQLSISDSCYLIGLLIVTVAKFFVKAFASLMLNFFYDVIIASVIMMLLTSPLAVRLVKLQFTIYWLLLSILYVVIGQKGLSFIPLTTFLLYHIIRQRYYLKYQEELVPPDMGKGFYGSYFSELIGRASTDRDYRYMKIMIWIMALLFGTLLFFNGKKI